MKLFVWTQFMPDYTDGLAFAIADDEESARQLVINSLSESESMRKWVGESNDWGPTKVLEVGQCGFCKLGGS
jgi:hypothetical protein